MLRIFSPFIVLLIAACGSIDKNNTTFPKQHAVPESWDDALGVDITPQWEKAQHREFDFWIGEWKANWRPRIEGEFSHAKEGSWNRHRVFPILDGKAIVELVETLGAENGEPSVRGFSIRYYDESRNRWVMVQNWPNPGFDGIAFTDQLMGDKHHGRFRMYSAATRPNPDGSRSHRRYIFSDITEDRFRWDGSNTGDRGETWTTWQVADFYRIGDQPILPAAGKALPGVYKENLCQGDYHDGFERFEGRWSGIVTLDDNSEMVARMTFGRVLDGCAVLGAIQIPELSLKRLMIWSYSPLLGTWVELTLENSLNSSHTYRISPKAGAGAIFNEAQDLTIRDEYTTYLNSDAFKTEQSQSRTVWRSVEDDEIVFGLEIHAGERWLSNQRFHLSRVD